MKKLLIIGSLILTVAVANAREGYYIGGEAGAGFLTRTPKKSNLQESFGAQSTKRERGRFLAGIHGGYIFDIDEQMSVAPQLGFRYVQKAKFKASNNTAVATLANKEIFNGSHQLNVIDLVAAGTYRINSMWDFQAKVGVALVADKVKVSMPGFTAGAAVPAFSQSKTKKSVRPEVGIGFGYLWHENMRLSLDASHIFGNKSKLSTLNKTGTAAQVLASQNQIFENFKKVPSLTSISVSLQYMF